MVETNARVTMARVRERRVLQARMQQTNKKEGCKNDETSCARFESFVDRFVGKKKRNLRV